MLKFSIPKFIERAILPLTLVVGVKLGTIFVINLFTKSSWFINADSDGLHLIFSQLGSSSEPVLISSLSDFATSLVCALGFTWVIFRSTHFNQATIHPHVSAHLHQKKQQHLLITTEDFFIEGGVWLGLSWSVLALTFLNFWSGLTTTWILGFVSTINIVLSLALFLELKKLLPYAPKT